MLFPPESLRRCRDLLEPGRAVSLKVRAKARDGEVRFFGDDAEPVETAIENAVAGLRIHVSPRSLAIDALKARLTTAPQGRGGEIVLLAPVEGGREIEVRPPGRFDLGPAVRGALKTAPGVGFVEDG